MKFLHQNPSRWKKEDTERMVTLLRDGLTVPKIAAQMGKGRDSVYKHLAYCKEILRKENEENDLVLPKKREITPFYERETYVQSWEPPARPGALDFKEIKSLIKGEANNVVPIPDQTPIDKHMGNCVITLVES